MTADPAVLDRIFDRLAHALSAGGPDQLRAPFTVAEMVQSLVPYRTYRNELGVDTLQDYEHALLEMLAGERGWLVCDPDTVAVIRKELASPDPDTGLLRRLMTVEVRMGAIRMPVAGAPRAPIAREGDDTTRAVVPDAVAIGAVMDREDAERAVSTARAASAAPEVKPAAKKARKTPRATPVVPASTPTAVPTAVAPVAPAAPPVTPANSRSGTPQSVPAVYGDPIDFRGVRHAPVDIGGVIFLFGMVARELGFTVESMSTGFPRCEAKRQLAPGKWARLRIDFEHESRQYRDAGRSAAACDLIVCWRDTWPDRPASLDVLALDRVITTLARD